MGREMGGEYHDGRRDAEIKALKISDREQWRVIRSIRNWQMRVVGYLSAITIALQFAGDYIIGKITG